MTRTSGAAVPERGDQPSPAVTSKDASVHLRLAPDSTDLTVLTNCRVVNLERGSVEPADVIVRDGTIVSLGRFGASPREAGALVLDLGGAWLMPGLIDAHAHLLGTADGPLTQHQIAARLAAYLAAGVTTVRDAGARDHSVLALAASTRIPQILAAGRPIRSSGSVEVASAAARAEAQAGASWLKAYGLDASELSGVLDVGRATGLPVGAHLGDDLEECLDLQPKAVEHVYTLIRHDLVPNEQREAPWIPAADRSIATWFLTDPDASWAAAWYESVGARRVFVTSTLLVMRALAGRPNADGREIEHAEATWAPQGQWGRWQARLQSWDWWQLQPDSSPELRDRAFENICRTASRLAAAGALVCVGTDFGEPLVEPGSGVLSEMKLLHSAGLSTLDVLRSSTSVPADLLGLRGAVGTLNVGARADVVALASNPLESLEALAVPALVMAAGEVVIDLRPQCGELGGA
jgi:imidazolonepropionase-like amidohydrolase